MKVLTLDRARFEADCIRLADMAINDGFVPDIVIGIATGGVYVMDAMRDRLEADFFSIRLQRPGTPAKQKVAGGIVTRLPQRVNNLLRICESRCYDLLSRVRRPRVPRVRLPEKLVTAIQEKESVLIVDDAVDSGVTLLAVIEAVARVGKSANVRTAVLTVTRKRRLLTPDYYLYRDLVRFPWSADASGTQF